MTRDRSSRPSSPSRPPTARRGSAVVVLGTWVSPVPELFGHQVKENVAGTAQEALEHSKQVAHETAGAAQEAAQSAVADIKDTAQQSAQEHGQQVKESAQENAQDTAQQARQTAPASSY